MCNINQNRAAPTLLGWNSTLEAKTHQGFSDERERQWLSNLWHKSVFEVHVAVNQFYIILTACN